MRQDRRPISRVLRSKAEASRTYSQISHWYPLLIDPFERRYRQAGLRLLSIQPGERVLGIGFGTGEGLLRMAQAVGPAGKVTGIDIAEGMCQVADHRLSRAGVREWVTLVCGDAAHMPFSAHAFDAVFMSFTLELFDTVEVPVVLTECRRVLRSGGRICLVSMGTVESPGVMLRLYEWAHRMFPTLVDCRPIYADDAMVQAGFHLRSQTRFISFGLPIDIVLATA